MPVATAHDRAPDAARSLWAPVTIRVAWELVLAGVPVRPEVLAEAREHVLRCLPPGVGAAEGEELAVTHVAEWLDRVRRGRYRHVPPDPDSALPLTASWRHRLSASLDQVADAVFRLHYGDGFTLEAVGRSAALDPSLLEGARGGIRETLRAIAAEEGISLSGWSIERLDTLAGRVARLPEPGCPGPVGLLTDEGRTHADGCPRCSRAVRLVRGGILSPGDLFAPDAEQVRPTQRRRVLALLLHPDGRRHRTALVGALAGHGLPVGGDAWVIDDSDVDAVGQALHALALEGTPARHHLRGALYTGSGRWIRGRLVGPLPLLAVEAARSRPWGEVMGVPELPPPLPPAPQATRWWLAAGALGLLAIATGFQVLHAPAQPPIYPLQTDFHRDAGGWEVRFDTDELAVLDVVVRREGRLELVEHDVRAGKGAWATGEGDYRLKLPGQDIVVISSAHGIPSLPALVADARRSADPLATLAAEIQASEPRAAIAASEPPD